MKRLADFLNQRPKMTILDVGTGAGNFISLITQLYQDYETIIGIDTLDIAISSASKNFQKDDKISFVKMDAHKMDFPDESFDLVVLSNSLHHLKDLDKILSEMVRVTKTGGYILISEMISNKLNPQQLAHLKMHHFAAEIDRYMGDVHNETYTDDQIRIVLQEHCTATIVDDWFLEYERKQDNTDEEITWLKSTIDRVIQRVTNETDKQEFIQKGEELKRYIDVYGFDSATTMIVVMRK